MRSILAVILLSLFLVGCRPDSIQDTPTPLTGISPAASALASPTIEPRLLRLRANLSFWAQAKPIVERADKARIQLAKVLAELEPQLIRGQVEAWNNAVGNWQEVRPIVVSAVDGIAKLSPPEGLAVAWHSKQQKAWQAMLSSSDKWFGIWDSKRGKTTATTADINRRGELLEDARAVEFEARFDLTLFENWLKCEMEVVPPNVRQQLYDDFALVRVLPACVKDPASPLTPTPTMAPIADSIPKDREEARFVGDFSTSYRRLQGHLRELESIAGRKPQTNAEAKSISAALIPIVKALQEEVAQVKTWGENKVPQKYSMLYLYYIVILEGEGTAAEAKKRFLDTSETKDLLRIQDIQSMLEEDWARFTEEGKRLGLLH